MHDLATLSDLAEAEIAALAADGIDLTPSEVIEINALAWSVQTPESRQLLARGRPVKVGQCWLWPLTMLSVDWLERNGFRTDAVTPALGYAMAYGSDTERMSQYGREAEKAVNEWYRTLPVTPAEFVEAVTQLDRQDTRIAMPLDADARPMSVGEFSMFLTAVAGGDPDFWERRCAVSYSLSVLTTVVIQNHADKRPSKHDPRIQAERALGIAIDRIRQRHAAEVNRG